jgi:hypothetical protein
LCQEKVDYITECADCRLDSTTQEKLDLMRLNALVQLRDCLTELFKADTVENGLSQATYLLKTFRRLLLDENRKTDSQGISVIYRVNLQICSCASDTLSVLESKCLNCNSLRI